MEPRRPAELEESTLLTRAFAPIDRRAFGLAIATVAGLVIFVLTVVTLLFAPAGTSGMSLLAQYFYGYTVSWGGAVIGLFWGGAVGFVVGWFVAFWRNLVIAASIFITQTRAELRSARDFLDHI